MNSSIAKQPAYAAVQTSSELDGTSSPTITDTVFEVLHAFTGDNGSNSSAYVIQLGDGTLYGTTVYSGGGLRCGPPAGSGCGTLFKLAPDGATYSLFMPSPPPVQRSQPVGCAP